MWYVSFHLDMLLAVQRQQNTSWGSGALSGVRQTFSFLQAEVLPVGQGLKPQHKSLM